VHGVQSPQKVPDTPNRPTSARASPLKESRLKPVPVKSFYTVATTKSFKDFDEDLTLAPAFLVEKDGRLVRSDHVKLQEEQVRAIAWCVPEWFSRACGRARSCALVQRADAQRGGLVRLLTLRSYAF
jgi:hypothetical protein